MRQIEKYGVGAVFDTFSCPTTYYGNSIVMQLHIFDPYKCTKFSLTAYL